MESQRRQGYGDRAVGVDGARLTCQPSTCRGPLDHQFTDRLELRVGGVADPLERDRLGGRQHRPGPLQPAQGRRRGRSRRPAGHARRPGGRRGTRRRAGRGPSAGRRRASPSRPARRSAGRAPAGRSRNPAAPQQLNAVFAGRPAGQPAGELRRSSGRGPSGTARSPTAGTPSSAAASSRNATLRTSAVGRRGSSPAACPARR